MQEFETLPGFEQDEKEQAEVRLGTVVYKGLRCCFMARSYMSAEKWPEAVALFTRFAFIVPDHGTQQFTHYSEQCPGLHSAS